MIKRVSDYVDALCEMYPYVPKKDILKIINYGWRMFYYYSLRGCDITSSQVRKRKWFYCGNQFNNSILFSKYYRRKLRRKIRVLWGIKRKKWDGYYYTAITEDEYNKIKKKFGRPVTNLTVKNKVLFKIKNEAFVFYNTAKYFIRCKLPIDYGYSVHKETCKCKEVKLILERKNPLTLNDLIKIGDNEKRSN